SHIGGDYIVVGDGGFCVTQVQAVLPNMCKIRRTNEAFEMEYITYPAAAFELGSLVVPYVPGNDQYYLSSGEVDTFNMEKPELKEFLSMENIPVIIDNQLAWSSKLDFSRL
ncbi:MAG: hypothetical protein ABEK02_07000, partial [Haloquadratum sp.]